MDYLIRLAQLHESFRKAELEALAKQENINLEVRHYLPESPFCIVHFNQPANSQTPLENVARSFMSRSILARGIYELWGQGDTYEMLHEDMRRRSPHLWEQYKQTPFRFTIDSFGGRRSMEQQKQIINSLRYLGFTGKISMKTPEVEFVIFEEWDQVMQLSHDMMKLREPHEIGQAEERTPKRIFFGRYVGGTRRHLSVKHDLKKRPYISTTSMDAELALVTANLALAGPGKIFLDPFVGTGGFMVAASELGALTFGADIDGRSYKGKGPGLENGVGANFKKYGLEARFGDCFASDLTNTPLRLQSTRNDNGVRWLDGIMSDPPYGVREGLKVLGTRQRKPLEPQASATGNDEPVTEDVAHVQQPHYIGGVLAHTLPGYIAPKKPYSFMHMLDDILDFAARTLVDGGRLAFWMPSANEADQEFGVPKHPFLELKHTCVQSFGKWSRRLLVYQRIPGDVDESAELLFRNGDVKISNAGASANDLNPFRKMYFKGFQT